MIDTELATVDVTINQWSLKRPRLMICCRRALEGMFISVTTIQITINCNEVHLFLKYNNFPTMPEIK